MTKVLADALVPIFTGLLLGYWAGRRGLMDSINIRNLIVFVMNFAAPCALFSIIIGTSREVLRQQVMTAFVIALVFTGIYLGCYFWGPLSCRHVHPRRRCARFDLPPSAAERSGCGHGSRSGLAVGQPCDGRSVAGSSDRAVRSERSSRIHRIALPVAVRDRPQFPHVRHDHLVTEVPELFADSDRVRSRLHRDPSPG